MGTTDPSRTRRIELILRQIDSLPTLPAIATRLLALTASDDSSAHDVVELVSTDPVITAKVLALCRSADRGLRNEVITIDRAVVLLGFDAVRNAVLSVKVLEMFQDGAAAPGRGGRFGDGALLDQDTAGDDARPFDRTGFWRHSLAVAICAELIARHHPRHKDLSPDEAFVGGLLHDIGKLALDHVLPRSFARVVELADLNQGNIAEFERRIIGIDHHTAGKRMAEQWQLPHLLQDCIWLHGTAYESLPTLEHKRMVGLVNLADLIVRRHHLGYSGNYLFKHSSEALIAALELDHRCVVDATRQLHEEIQRRASALGLDDTPSRELFLESIQRANHELGRLNSALDRRSRTAVQQAGVLDAISAFHNAATPGRSVQDVLQSVIASAQQVLGAGFYGMLHQADQPNGSRAWLVCQYNDEAHTVHSQLIEPPPHSPDLAGLDPSEPVAMNLMGILPWVADFLINAPDLRQVRLLPLICGWGTCAIMLHDRVNLPPGLQLAAITATWGAAVAAAGQHDGARRLGEELAQANRELAEAQDRLLQSESMARLGEMAAGAAHEMNNPLAVISGRSELLTMTLTPGSKENKAAATIYEQAHRLSNLITSLRMFADPPRAQRCESDVVRLLQDTINRVRAELTGPDARKAIFLEARGQVGKVNIDARQVDLAVAELLHNAMQASPKASVNVTVQVDEIDRTLIIQVVDDGTGMDEHVLTHAMDPFFSAKAAGRRMGMGLPRVKQWAAAHGGTLELRSTVNQGTLATLTIPLDSTASKADG